MSNSLGDFDASTVVYGKFSTYRPSTGATFTLAGTPVLSVYKDNGVTQTTTGVTLTADFDSVTGLNHFTIDTSADGTFYSAGSFFDVVITTGTVDSVSVTGSVVASFTIRKNSALKPTTAARTLDVSAGGEAGIDWANIGSPTTAVNLSATNIDVDQVVASVSGAVGSVTGAVGSVTGLTASNLDVAVSTLATQASVNTIDDFLDTEMAAVLAAVDTEVAAIKTKTDFLPSVTAGDAGGLFIAGTNAATTVNFTGSLSGSVGSVTGAVGSVTGNVGGNVAGSVGSVTAGVTVTTNNDKTGYAVGAGGIANTAFAAGAIDAAAIAANAIGASELAQDAAQEIADEVLNRDLAGGASGNTRNVRNALRSLRNKAAIAGGTLTVYQENDTDAAWTAAVTTAAGDPLSSIDPT